MEATKVRILFVCLGNICRSPAAEGTFRHLVGKAGLLHRFEIDSAGTAAYHTGEAPNANSRKAAAGRGIELRGQARQFVRADFRRFDYIFAMDRSNFQGIIGLASGSEDRGRVFLFREFPPEQAEAESDVPDPYYGGPEGFENVQDILLSTGGRLLKWLILKHSLK